MYLGVFFCIIYVLCLSALNYVTNTELKLNKVNFFSISNVNKRKFSSSEKKGKKEKITNHNLNEGTFSFLEYFVSFESIFCLFLLFFKIEVSSNTDVTKNY